MDNIVKSQLLEELYDLESVIEDNKDIRIIIDKVMTNSITEEEVTYFINKFREDISNQFYDIKTFFNDLKSKTLYKNIELFMQDNLSDIKIWKMVSSLITQIIIHKENISKFEVEESGYDELCEILKRFTSMNIVKRNNEIKKIVRKLGYNDKE